MHVPRTLPRAPLLALLTACLPGCLEHPIKQVEVDKQGEKEETIALTVKKDVDILFVIDNSWSMGEEQALLSQNFKAFIDVLEQPGVDANYRIGVTTTDSGGPLCNGTAPEAGALVLSSCLDRVEQGEFTALTTQGEVDRVSACTDLCGLADADLPITPTATALDAEARPRRWIERIAGQTNLPPEVSAVEAFQCFGPQGIAGCGMEAPLESMLRALTAASDPDAPNYGFLRPDALLAVVFITDEADCSINPAFKSFFNTQSDPIFSNGGRPGSMTCWNMGVACEGEGPEFADCRPANWSAAGEVDVPDDEAMLHPVRRYVDFLQAIEDDKRLRDESQEVIVAMLVGVPPGYETGAAPLVYREDQDPAFVADYGVSPGCSYVEDGVALTRAVPPVRERAFAEAFALPDAEGEPAANLYSLCQSDYSPALSAIADRIRERIKPICMPGCVADTDEETALLEPNCEVYEAEAGATERRKISRCVEKDGAWAPPGEETVCYAELADVAGATGSALDDMSPACVEQGNNLEFKLVRSGPPPSGATLSYTANCELSPFPSRDCPDL